MTAGYTLGETTGLARGERGGYVQSSETLMVHKSECHIVNRENVHYWLEPWKPENVDQFDRACAGCLPNGIEGVLKGREQVRKSATIRNAAQTVKRIEDGTVTVRIDRLRLKIAEEQHARGNVADQDIEVRFVGEDSLYPVTLTIDYERWVAIGKRRVIRLSLAL